MDADAHMDRASQDEVGALVVDGADELDAEEEEEDDDDGDGDDDDDDNDDDGQAGAPAFLGIFAQIMGLNAQQIDSLQNVLPATTTGQRREGRLEGPATSAERARLDLVRGQQPNLRSILAISCARVASHLRQLAVQLPEEMILAIAQEVCRCEADTGSLQLQACSCEPAVIGRRLSAEDDLESLLRRVTLTFASPPPPACRAVCWRCGETSIERCTPRVRPLQGGQWHDLHSATLAVKGRLQTLALALTSNP